MPVLYMVIERYTSGPEPVYERAANRGRMLPAGLVYIDSWVTADSLDLCFQLMSADDPTVFGEWTRHWSDLVDFEIYPVVSSTEATTRALRS